MVLFENYLICIFMKINETLKMRTKPLHKLEPQGVTRPTLNSWEHSLLISNGSMRQPKVKKKLYNLQ